MDQIDIESASPVNSCHIRGLRSIVIGVRGYITGIRGAQGTKYRYIQRKYNLSELTKVSWCLRDHDQL